MTMIDTNRLKKVPESQWPQVAMRQKPVMVYRALTQATRWVVQVYDSMTPDCDGTPWQGTLTVSVKHTRANNRKDAMRRGFAGPIEWDDLQAIKDHFWPDRIAMEIYPPRDKIVDVADMRWLWVLPLGSQLPINLQDGEDTLR